MSQAWSHTYLNPRHDSENRDFTNQNATLPGTSPEVIFSQSASLRMFGAELQRVFFTFRARGLNFQRFQKTWVVSADFDHEFNLLFRPYKKTCFPKSMKILFIVKKYQTKHFNLPFIAGHCLPPWWMESTKTLRVRKQSRKLASKSNFCSLEESISRYAKLKD